MTTITTAAELAALPIGTTLIDKTDELIVKTGVEEYAMAADLGNGQPWAYLGEDEICGVYHSDLPVTRPYEQHVHASTFLPMQVHRIGGA